MNNKLYYSIKFSKFRKFKFNILQKILYQKSKYEIIYFINMSDYINIIEITWN